MERNPGALLSLSLSLSLSLAQHSIFSLANPKAIQSKTLALTLLKQCKSIKTLLAVGVMLKQGKSIIISDLESYVKNDLFIFFSFFLFLISENNILKEDYFMHKGHEVVKKITKESCTKGQRL